MSYPYKKIAKIGHKNIQIELFSDADASVFFEVFEEHEYNVLDDIIKNADTPIVDIGAHIGLFSIYVHALNEEVAIFAYEPEPHNFKRLKDNIKKNNVLNVYPKNLAVAAQAGKRLLYISPDSHNHSFIEIEDHDESQIVYTTTLEQIYEKLQKVSDERKYALLKIDCEGAEYEIIESAEIKHLKKFENIYIEYHEYNDEFKKELIIQKLKEAKFNVSYKISNYDKRFGFIFATHND